MLKTRSVISRIRVVLPKHLSSRLPREIGVVLLNIRESARLNLIYRNKNKAANVLSFYYSPEYGEILICPEVVKKEAARYGNTQDFQMTWMIVHGMIHLAGLHHEYSKLNAQKADDLERTILLKLKSKKEIKRHPEGEARRI